VKIVLPLVAAGLLAGTLAAPAAEPPREGRFGHAGFGLTEWRFGLQAHDPTSPERGTAALSGLALFSRPFMPAGAPAALLPMPHLGGSLNLGGKTSHIHAGLTWQLDLRQLNLPQGLFIEASFGAALHDGRTGRFVPPGHNALGCPVLFREAATLGYRLESGITVSATLEHLSNAGRCNANRGLTNLGVMVGYRF
jgi:lipid A 3-O-deacylase